MKRILLVVLSLFFSPLLLAVTIFNITTPNQTINAFPGETLTIPYTVQNTSGINMTGMKYFPPSGTTISSTTCGSSLANGASCTLQLTFHVPSTLGTITLGPMKVCGHNGQLCSQSNAANTVKIIILPGLIVTSSAGPNGSVSPNGSTTVASGSNLPFTATPDTNYAVEGWSVDGGAPVDAGNPNFTLTNITTNHTVHVTFVTTIGTLTFTIGPTTSLQYKSLHVVNNSSLNAQITSVTVAPALSGFVKWCQSGDGTCVQQSTCPIGMNIPPAPAPGSSCDLWFQSLDGSNIPIGPQPSGAIDVDTNDGVQHHFTADYEMDLYTGGFFTTAGGVTVNNIARWDGTNWFALSGPSGTGMNNQCNALTIFNGDLYAGGFFTTAGGVTVNGITRWNGAAWSPLGIGVSTPPFVLAVTGLNGNLYVGGSFTSAGGVTVNSLGRWNGTAWSSLGGMSTTVRALTTIGTDLYAGGDFTTVGIASGGVSANRIARWNTLTSTWSALIGPSGNGMSSNGVRALTTIGTDLYAGGSFTSAGGVTVNNIGRWNGTLWSALTGPSATGVAGPAPSISALGVLNSILYAGGSLITTAGGVSAINIAQWSGTAWSGLVGPSGNGMDDQVHSIAAQNGNVYAGGTFTTAGGVPAVSLARWNGAAWSAFPTGVSGSSPDVTALFPASFLTLH